MANLGDLAIRIGVNLDAFHAAMGSISDKLKGAEREAVGSWSGFEALGSRMTSVGMGLSAAVTAPLLGIAGASAQAFSGFEQSMNRVSALGEITGKDLEKLKTQAIDLGAKTQFSAKQAADGMAELSAAGFKATEVMSAMPAVLNLAAAGQISVGQASETTAAIMGGFGIKAEGVGHAVDVMAKAAASGALGVSDLGLSFKYIGPVATAAGISFEEVSAAVTLLSNAGIKGEQAGTSLRQAISRLIDPPKAAADALERLGITTTDTSGKLRPFSDIIGELGTKGASTKDIFAIFGDTAASAMQSLVNTGAPALRTMTAELQSSDGAAAKMAGTINTGLAGAWERAKGSIETAGISLGESLAPTIIRVAGIIESAANQVADFGKWFQSLPEPVQNTAVAFGVIAAAIGPLLIGIGTLTSAAASIGATFQMISPLLLAFAGTTIPSAIAAVTTFATVSIPAAVSALSTFALTTIPQAVTAAAVLSEVMLRDAAGSFLNFAKTAIPAVIAAMTTFVTVTIPEAIAAVSTFSLTTIPQMTAAFVSFASTGVAGATTAITGFATTAIPAAISGIQTLALTALPLLGVAAATGAAAFAGWNIGKWAYDAIPGVKALGDGLASLILFVPGVQSLIDRMGGLTKATSELEGGTKKLEALAEKLGVNITDLSIAYKSGSISLDKYNSKLNDLIRTKIGAAKAASSVTDATGKTKTAQDQAKAASDALNKILEQQKTSLGGVSGGMTDYVAKTAPVVQRNAVLDEMARILTQRYNEKARAIAEAKIKLMDMGDTIATMLGPSEDLNRKIQDIVSSTEALRKAAPPMGIDLSAAIKAPIPAAGETAEAIDDISTTVDGVVTKSKGAWGQFGTDITGIANQTKTVWSDWSKQVSTITTDLGKDMAKILFDGDKSWGEKAKAMWESLGQAVTRMFVEPAMNAIGDLISGTLADLIGGKGLGGVLDRIKDIGSSIGGVFSGGGGSAASSAGGASIPSGGGGSGVGAAAGAGTAAVVGAVAGVVTAISGVIGNFQMAHQETSLNAIEHNTRYSMMFLGERADGGILGQMFRIADAIQYVPGLLDAVNAKMDNWLQPLDGTLDGIAGQMALALTKLDDISSNTYWGLRADQDNTIVLGEIRDTLRGQRDQTGLLTEIRDAIRSLRSTGSNTAGALSLQGVKSY